MATENEENDENTKDIYYDCNSANNHKILKGKLISTTGKYTRRNINNNELIKLFSNNLITIPDFQRTLNIDKIEKMIEKFKKNKEYFNNCTNPLQLAYLHDIDNYLLIDGQHRYNMLKKLNDTITDYVIPITIINCDNIEETYDIYKEINIDNANILEIKSFEDIIKYKKLEKLILTEYKDFFLNKNAFIYSIDEFIKALSEGSFLIQFNSIQTAFQYILEINKIYHNKFYTETNIKSIKLNAKEKTFIESKVIFSFRNNNFLDLLLYSNITTDENYECTHFWIDKNSKKSFTNQF